MILALFDFDGTVTTTDTFSKFMRYVIPKNRKILGMPFVFPYVFAYRKGWISGTTVRQKIVRIGLTGVNAEKLQQSGINFSKDIIPQFIRPEAIQKIRWHKTQGHKVVIVSASLDIYLQEWCENHKLDLISSKLEVKKNKITGKYLGTDCSRQDKVKKIKNKYNLEEYDFIYAYGDTTEDLDMLNIADKKFYCWKEI